MPPQLHEFCSSNPVPIHSEAYPSFAIKSADRHWRENRPCCDWEDRFGQIVGQMQVTAIERDRLGISYTFGYGPTRERHSMSLRIARCHLTCGRYEARAFCPSCHEIKDRLFYRWQRWGCQQCQKLVQRRSLLGPMDTVIVKRDRLLRKIYGPGSESRSGLATIGARRELARLTRILDDAGAVRLVSPPLDHLLSTRWFDPENDPLQSNQPLATHDYLDLPRPK